MYNKYQYNLCSSIIAMAPLILSTEKNVSKVNWFAVGL